MAHVIIAEALIVVLVLTRNSFSFRLSVVWASRKGGL